ncbi:PrsW family intramembrane metalloprotease [Candidatus Kaiserbacteria bacterium]|nr:PrsW family intramembrane metalloprotease [Candidatus Kaiserbacteria bacterium]
METVPSALQTYFAGLDVFTAIIAFLAGAVPAVFWVWFWLREDRAHPEPLFMLLLAFIAGMAVVPLALPLQELAMHIYQGDNRILVWVVIEETLKYALALGLVLWHREVDEPIDMVVYLIVIALGFAALENTLFLYNPLVLGDYMQSLLTGGFRFLGATLLHVLASATIGMCLALTYYQPRAVQLAAGTGGLFVAIVLHYYFNVFIMDASGETILSVFLFVWLGVIVLFLLFEKVKLLERAHTRRK